MAGDDQPDPGIELTERGSSWRAVLRPYVISRLCVLLAGYASLKFVPLDPQHTPWQFLPDDLLFDGLVRWDSGWYRSILSYGYFFDNFTDENIHFFPVYPLLVSVVMRALPPRVEPQAAFAYSAIFVSHIAFFIGLAGVHQLVVLKSDWRTANRTVWLMSLFPYAFFASAAYTESTYLALAAWAFVLAERRRWAVASVLSAIAGATRIPGLFVGASLGLMYLAHANYRLSALRRDGLWLLLAPLGCALYAGYLALRFHSPLILLDLASHSQTLYGVSGVSAHIVHVFTQDINLTNLIERLTLGGSLAIVAAVVAFAGVAGVRFGVAYAVFPLASIAFASAYTLDANGRYASVLFPAFLAAAAWLSTRTYLIVCGLGLVSGAVLCALFSHWHHIT